MKEANRKFNWAIIGISLYATWVSGFNILGFILLLAFLKGITLILDVIMPKIAPLIEEHSRNQ